LSLIIFLTFLTKSSHTDKISHYEEFLCDNIFLCNVNRTGTNIEKF